MQVPAHAPPPHTHPGVTCQQLGTQVNVDQTLLCGDTTLLLSQELPLEGWGPKLQMGPTSPGICTPIP